MCGIIGIFNRDNSQKLVSKGLNILKNRGKDAEGIVKIENNTIGHCLHSIVGKNIKQPLKGKGILSSNCEIYNWQELNDKFKLNARNDSELLFNLIEKNNGNTKKILNELDGVYAFA